MQNTAHVFSSRADAETNDGQDALISHLGSALVAKGTLDAGGTLFVYGTVYGRINAERLVVKAGGYVEGDVVAQDVQIEGRLNGRIFAVNVAVESTADVSGRIFHHNLSVARGARVDGRMPWRPVNYFETLDELPEIRA